MPVHRWCVRHVYIPVVDLGYSRTAASLIVFFISAFFHEYLVSEPINIAIVGDDAFIIVTLWLNISQDWFDFVFHSE